MNPYSNLLQTFDIENREYSFYDLPALDLEKYEKLPFCMRVLLEAAVRNCDGSIIKPCDIENILNWPVTHLTSAEIPFRPARVLLHDFTGIPAIVDFAAMRDTVKKLGGDPEKINPVCPVDLVIDHSIQVDVARSILKNSPNPGGGQSQLLNSHVNPCTYTKPTLPITDHICPFHHLPTSSADALLKNQELEFKRNEERFIFMKWGARALRNVSIIPPGSGIIHQVNLEYLARVLFVEEESNLLYPDTVVGTDSHTTMINGLGVLGWGVGGIEAEAVMLGQAITLVLPQVVGYKLTGTLPQFSTSTDLVLTITKNLRQIGVIGKFVEFFGDGVEQLSIADRATISNMCPEYGATVAYFPTDEQTLSYLQQTGRDEHRVKVIEMYMREMKLMKEYNSDDSEPIFSQVVELDLCTVKPCCSGPKRPHDKVDLCNMKRDFQCCLESELGFKGFGVSPQNLLKSVAVNIGGENLHLKHGSIVLAAITSCTNTSNPSVMLSAGLLAKNAVELGLKVSRAVKTSLSPGSGVVTAYLKESGVMPYLIKLGFEIVGYGCMSCIGNSGPLCPEIADAIEQHDIVAVSVLSGNRNFEGRVHPLTKANYLASPPLVVAYALAGRIDIDFTIEPLGYGTEGQEIFLHDIWPTRNQVGEIEQLFVRPMMFKEVYAKIQKGNDQWNALDVPDGCLYPWDTNSNYITPPPFFNNMSVEVPMKLDIKAAYVLLNLGDSVSTDHISPAGSISRSSPAARYLIERGLNARQFNSYGSRRGNDAVMARGTFANIRLVNKFLRQPGPKTIYHPTNEQLDVYDAAERYRTNNHSLIILAGKDYGQGSSRDWAAKGPWMLGVRAVLAVSYERIHRSNLIGMGILPLQYMDGQNAEMLQLSGRERYTIVLPDDLKVDSGLAVTLDDGRSFTVKACFSTTMELTYFRHGGILNYMIRQMLIT